MSFSDYMAQYQVDGAGHLNPLGNHFVAYALKQKLVSMLDPKPIPYQDPAAQRIEFEVISMEADTNIKAAPRPGF
jgi:hypothetical protein